MFKEWKFGRTTVGLGVYRIRDGIVAGGEVEVSKVGLTIALSLLLCRVYFDVFVASRGETFPKDVIHDEGDEPDCDEAYEYTPGSCEGCPERAVCDEFIYRGGPSPVCPDAKESSAV